MMVDRDWYPTPSLRWMLGILQQRYVREVSEYRNYNGVQRLAKWTEEDWRQVREASQAEVDAARAAQETGPSHPITATGPYRRKCHKCEREHDSNLPPGLGVSFCSHVCAE